MVNSGKNCLNFVHWDGNGEISPHFVGIRTSHNKNRGNALFSSRNRPLSPCGLVMAVWRSYLIIIKKYCIIFIESEKRTLSENNLYQRRISMRNR